MNEEILYIGIHTKGYKTCRIEEILRDADDELTPLYYAALPTSNSTKWHTKHDEWTFRTNGTRLVAFWQPALLRGFPVIEIEKECNVETRYNQMRYEASKMSLGVDYKINIEKPLTYTFIYELPKYILEKNNGVWALKKTKNFEDVIQKLEQNFYSEEDINQRYRNEAASSRDFPDCGIGAYHGDW